MNLDLGIAREPQVPDEQTRTWMLDRLEAVRECIEAGLPVVPFDGGGTTWEGKRTIDVSFSFYADEWARAHRERVKRKTGC